MKIILYFNFSYFHLIYSSCITIIRLFLTAPSGDTPISQNRNLSPKLLDLYWAKVLKLCWVRNRLIPTFVPWLQHRPHIQNVCRAFLSSIFINLKSTIVLYLKSIYFLKFLRIIGAFSVEKIRKTHSSKALSVSMKKVLVFLLGDLPKVTWPGTDRADGSVLGRTPTTLNQCSFHPQNSLFA